MQLFGSIPSPYVRRIRIWAQQNNCALEFINLDIFSKDDRPLVVTKNPAAKIPILVDDTLTLSDSNTILRYLLEKTQHPPLTWPQEHFLIRACNDSFLNYCYANVLDLTRKLINYFLICKMSELRKHYTI